MRKFNLKEFRDWGNFVWGFISAIGVTTLFAFLKNSFTFFTIELEFQMWHLLSLLSFIVFLTILCIRQIKTLRKLRKELHTTKNPSDPNLTNFKKGELVFLRTNLTPVRANALTVEDFDYGNSKIVCRNRDGVISSHYSNELFLHTETMKQIDEIETLLRQETEPFSLIKW